MKHIKRFNEMTESEKYSQIYDTIRTLIETKDFEGVKSLMEFYLNDSETNPGDLKTILIITKGFKDHPVFGDTRKEVLRELEARLGQKIV